MSKSNPSNQSPLLFGLSEASKLAVIEEAKEQEPSFDGVRPVRGASPQPPAPNTPAGALVGQLDDMNLSIASQIASVEKWLRDHPDILRILDKAILGHYRRSERRTALANTAINAIFCIVGAVIGLLLPGVLPALGHLLAR